MRAIKISTPTAIGTCTSIQRHSDASAPLRSFDIILMWLLTLGLTLVTWNLTPKKCLSFSPCWESKVALLGLCSRIFLSPGPCNQTLMHHFFHVFCLIFWRQTNHLSWLASFERFNKVNIRQSIEIPQTYSELSVSDILLDSY